MRRQHPQDIAFGAVIDRDDMKTRRVLIAVAAPAPPLGLGPFIALPAAHFERRVHTFEPRPGFGLGAQGGDIELTVRLVGDDSNT